MRPHYLLPLQLPEGAGWAGFAFEPVQLPVGVGAEAGAAFDPLQPLSVEVAFVAAPVPLLPPLQLPSALHAPVPSMSPAPASSPAILNPARYFFRSWVSMIHLLSSRIRYAQQRKDHRTQLALG